MHASAAGPTVLRLALGAVFVGHGARKLFGVWGGDGPTGTAAFFNQLGLTPAYLLGLGVGIVELVGGLLLVAGLFTVPVSAMLALNMAVAVWKVHFANGFFLNWKNAPGVGHGFEYNLVLIAALAALMFIGPGALSFDSRRLKSAETEAAGRARLRAGSVGSLK